jgi:hypothetical protein
LRLETPDMVGDNTTHGSHNHQQQLHHHTPGLALSPSGINLMNAVHSYGGAVGHNSSSSANGNSNNNSNNNSNTGGNFGGGGGGGGGMSKPPLTRSVSHNASIESHRQAIAEIISQIRKYDPYPCILGIPVMPALFNSSKCYIFIVFTLLGVRMMISCWRQL